jgi:aryl-alcohol dehydrogenase-like predicted oxidoreductase
MIAKSVFGRTGHTSSRVLLGAAAFSKVEQAEADAAIELALSYGVNHVDVAASYGEAELRVGDWIRRHGVPFFLATKTDERTAPKAREEFLRSLERLHVDKVDLLQLHFLIDPAEWEIALGSGGALEALIRLREEGLISYIGITGHGLTAPAMHSRALERFDFDSVLLPYSFLMHQIPEYQADFDALLQICRERNVAVQTIKSLVHTPWGDAPHTRATWYRPLEEQVDIDKAVQWVLGHEDLFLNSIGDVNLLPRVLNAADRFTVSPSDAEMRAQVGALTMESLFSD